MKNPIKKNSLKIVAIYGSPRRNGCTDTLMDLFLKGVHECKLSKKFSKIEIEKIYCNKLNINPCRECRSCSKTGECIIKDDMQDIYPKLIKADFIAVATPIFFTTVSGYLKALIDRCQRFWSLKYEHKKNIFRRSGKGVMISTAGSGSRTIFDCAEKTIKAFFDVIYIDYIDKFVLNNIETSDDILKNDDAKKNIYNFGRELERYLNEI